MYTYDVTDREYYCLRTFDSLAAARRWARDNTHFYNIFRQAVGSSEGKLVASNY